MFLHLALWTWLRVDSTQRSTTSQSASRHHPPPSIMTAFVFLPCAKHKRMRCVFSGACARLRSRADGLCPWRASWAWTRCFGWIFKQTNESNRILWHVWHSVCHTIPSMQVNVPMGEIIDLYSVESEIDTNGFMLAAHWYDTPLSLHEVLGSSLGFMQTF